MWRRKDKKEEEGRLDGRKRTQKKISVEVQSGLEQAAHADEKRGERDAGESVTSHSRLQ